MNHEKIQREINFLLECAKLRGLGYEEGIIALRTGSRILEEIDTDLEVLDEMIAIHCAIILNEEIAAFDERNRKRPSRNDSFAGF